MTNHPMTDLSRTREERDDLQGRIWELEDELKRVNDLLKVSNEEIMEQVNIIAGHLIGSVRAVLSDSAPKTPTDTTTHESAPQEGV